MADIVGSWAPKTIERWVGSAATSSNVIEVVTERGPAFVKALGNPGGPHILACELVGTQLAAWLGLRTLEYAIIEVTARDNLPFAGGGTADPGPAFIRRKEVGTVWHGSEGELKLLWNQDDIPLLVALDTWTLNKDRYTPDSSRRPNRANVWLSKDGAPSGQYTLKAIDHTHCFSNGRDRSERIADIGSVKDDRVYGCFPEFTEYMLRTSLTAAARKIASITRSEIECMVARIPREWEVSPQGREALTRLILERAGFVAARLEDLYGWRDAPLPLDG